MELAFRTKSLRTVCEDVSKAEAKLGRRITEALIPRLADLRAAPVASDLPFEWEATEGGKPGLRVWLVDSHWMVWRVNHQQVPRNESGTDWTSVRRIRLDSIEGVNE